MHKIIFDHEAVCLFLLVAILFIETIASAQQKTAFGDDVGTWMEL